MQVILNIAITLVLSILAIGLLVFIHELGHFLAAKRSGVVVQDFAFGFGPTIWSKKHNGTFYKINLIPFGGYVRMLGDLDGSSLARFGLDPVSESDRGFVRNLFYDNHIDPVKDEFDRIDSFYQAQKEILSEVDYQKLKNYIEKEYIPMHPGNFDNIKNSKKLLVVTAGVIMNFLLGILLLYIYFAFNGNYTDLRKLGDPKFIGAEVNVPPVMWFDYSTDNIGESIIIKANGQLIKSKEDLQAVIDASYNKEIEMYVLSMQENKYKTVQKVLDGDNLASSFDKDFADKIMISATDNTGAAYSAGLSPGDIIIAVNGQNPATIDDFKLILAANRGKSIALQLWDGEGNIKSINVSLPNVEDGKPILGASLIKTNDILAEYDTMLGAIRVTYQKYPYLSGILHSVNMTSYNFTAMYELVKQSVREKSIQPVSQSVSSILAVPDIFYTLIRGDNYLEILNIGALISISLAIMNILPIPLFDGGHIMFMVIEKVRGKKLSQKSQEKISSIVFYILIALSIVIVLKDVIQFDWLNRLIGLISGFFK